jgi:hypothetical protein
MNRSQFIAVRAKSKMAAAAILDYRKMDFCTRCRVGVIVFYPHTKFEVNQTTRSLFIGICMFGAVD